MIKNHYVIALIAAVTILLSTSIWQLRYSLLFFMVLFVYFWYTDMLYLWKYVGLCLIYISIISYTYSDILFRNAIMIRGLLALFIANILLILPKKLFSKHTLH
jgi:hypothetical protein